MSKKRSIFMKWTMTTLVLTYLVIVAGSVVRATGSGMGCPDWPKCFGHFIPPTELAELEFREGKQFRKGHFIIWNEALWKAKRELTAGQSIDPNDWERYTKHDYARFNAMHTWTEYVNRLMGALLGLASLVMLVLSFRIAKEDRALPWLSGLTVFLIAFEGWLGATVVESNLMPAKITTHMLVALVIIAVLLGTLARARYGTKSQSTRVPALINALLWTAMGASLLQIILGTQVREQVDELDKLWNGAVRYKWVEQLGSVFYVHRLMAYGVIIANTIMIYSLWKSCKEGWTILRWPALFLLLLLAAEWLSGAGLALFGLPVYIQPVHLVLAMIIFGLQFHLWTLVRTSCAKSAA